MEHEEIQVMASEPDATPTQVLACLAGWLCLERMVSILRAIGPSHREELSGVDLSLRPGDVGRIELIGHNG
jgi:hypothetical protein